ncbi:MAG TPA: LPS assembly lipoprotein LptE [Burkholderiales bacterium]|jgi:LPS-assembly lipoprotein|nr:LPS assembly lipoprotein LptE [Burkholderiales bacterium]
MSWFNIRIVARLAVIASLGAVTAGCFQPMYAEHNPNGGPGLRDKLAQVEFAPLNVNNASPTARIGVAIRNEMMFRAYGAATGLPPKYRLTLRLSTQNMSIVIDPNTTRPDINNYGIDATYELRDIDTNKPLISGNTTARVSYDIPGQEQRFAQQRALRDAEDRAAKEIAENISTRLASYFYANM